MRFLVPSFTHRSYLPLSDHRHLHIAARHESSYLGSEVATTSEVTEYSSETRSNYAEEDSLLPHSFQQLFLFDALS